MQKIELPEDYKPGDILYFPFRERPAEQFQVAITQEEYLKSERFPLRHSPIILTKRLSMYRPFDVIIYESNLFQLRDRLPFKVTKEAAVMNLEAILADKKHNEEFLAEAKATKEFVVNGPVVSQR